MDDLYNILINKLDEFIRKYYKNQLIRGTIYCSALLLLFFLIITLLEYFGHFGIITRTVLFYSYVLINIVIIWRFIAISVLKLFKIGKIISDEYAADIIGRHFSEVKDKLLNTLQLKKLNDLQLNPELQTLNSDLIKASIQQKIIELKPIPFSKAIDLRINKKYLKYPLIPLIIIIAILFVSPGLLTKPSERIIKHNVFFEREFPFSVNILNRQLLAVQQEDFRLDIKIAGSEIPDKAYIIIDNSKFQLHRDNNILFHHVFKNIQKDVIFQLAADKYTSKQYLLKVLPKPIIINFSLNLNYPEYTGKQDETLENTGDIVVPAGTWATWKFITKDTRAINIRLLKSDNYQNLSPSAESVEIVNDNNNSNIFKTSKLLLNNLIYSISLKNSFLKNSDSLVYTASVIPDAYPSIDVEEYRDSIYRKHVYFKGIIKDDYGFRKLTFNYYKINRQKQEAATADIESRLITVNPRQAQQQFYYHFDISQTDIVPGEEIAYFFEITDNDAITGPKSSQSQKKIYKEPSKKEIEEMSKNKSNQLASDIKESLREAQNLQSLAEELSRKIIEKNDLNWQEKKQVQDIMDKQKTLRQKMEDIKNMFKEKNLQEDMFDRQMNEEIMQKRDELQKLFDELLSDEMKKMMQQLEEMMHNINKDQINQMLDKIKISNKDLMKELDRNLQLMKQLEFEKKLSEVIDKLKELSKKQDEMSEETKKPSDNSQQTNDKLIEKQQQANDEFNDIRKNIDEMQQKNKELDEPNNLMDTKEKENEIQNEMQNGMNSLKTGNKKNASKSQKNAAQKMENLAQNLQEMKDQMEDQQDAEDIDKLRDLLENLIRLSFAQETNMQDLRKTSRSDPKYIRIINKQKELKDQLKLIEDTLYAISKRQAEIKSFVNKKIIEINQNVDKTIRSLLDSYTVFYTGDANRSVALTSQQFTMTAINDLALMISESIDQMNQKLSDKQSKCSSKKCRKGGKNPSNCSKPGGNKESLRSMRMMQQALNKKLEELKKGINPFGNSLQKQQQINEQLARLAAEQEAIRKQLQNMSEEFKNSGKDGAGNFNNLMKQMEQTETDLVNKSISLQTINRQKDILSRLLESEKAQLERETDKKRESNEAKNQNFSNPNKFFEYNRIKLREEEMLKTAIPALKPFYRNKVNEYFIKFED